MQLDIIDPPSAVDQRLAKNQEFTLQATVLKSGDADLIGLGSLSLILDPDDGIEIVAIPGDSTFTWPDSIVTWRLRTPDRLITTNLLVNYTTIPMMKTPCWLRLWIQ